MYTKGQQYVYNRVLVYVKLTAIFHHRFHILSETILTIPFRLKAWPNWTTLFANMSIIMLVECSWTFHVVDRSGQIGKRCSPTNSIRHKLNAVYVVSAAV